ncbi:pyruvate formate-lyase activating enzyme [Klebsiella pneumoniae]|nr:pyruvate formate-lyase activating enzyme [Klebsiella pneumoniae]SWP78896.1 pyruvate formate-lyase activating enzyme [Klebsiella pneumoniae]SXO78042.1 pyruvate formate-lyase activating enzyme [Klebsiella pneumoniae]SXV13887.1 pyruvate formate-lyase activating enzyme [Klebsiella pneumoniae]VCW39969.1 Benzylsuccinate synthase activating enzyme [Klebsiella pneumoniae]
MTLSAAPRISCEVIDTRADRARIFNLQRYSLNDGQGIRTVVFFKGCPHTCPWCANPESISPRIQTLRRESKCLRCTRCQQDVAECPSGAWEQIGRDVTLDNLLQEVLKDEVFFRASGGGVTLSGGEVLMRPGLPPAFSSACASGGSAPPSKPRATALLTAFCRWPKPVMKCCLILKSWNLSGRGRCCE